MKEFVEKNKNVTLVDFGSMYSGKDLWKAIKPKYKVLVGEGKSHTYNFSFITYSSFQNE